MRNNGPVTSDEWLLQEGATLVSTTDLASRITYVNPAFIAASGFTREELVGQPHNVIRHPDMPAEAFRDMWATLQSGRPWSALVKNRRRNGDFYWVRANVTPVIDGGAVVGYMSVRTRPSREEVATAEALYRQMRDEAARGKPVRRLREGALELDTWSGRWRRRMQFGIAMRAALACTFVPAAAAAFAVWSPLGAAAAIAAGAIAGGLLAVSMRRLAVQPLVAATEVANRMAAGDLGLRLDSDRLDEVGRLNRGLGQLNVNLQAIVGDVRSEVDGINTASREISNGNADLSSRTEAQASNLQQTAASLEQMTAAIQRNAEAARSASSLACEATEVAQRGGAAVADAARRMDEIREASARIVDIIGTVDAISFQTNLLALNAAVEAARAGSAGRGFAVVAGEVHALAKRTSDAAREVKALIRDSSHRIDAGAALVQTTGETVRATIEAVGQVSALVSDISHASDEQATGVKQVNAAVANLDSLTQQNAAMVEQLAASAASLAGQASVVAEAVRVFRTT